MIGLDGADWELIEKFNLPHLLHLKNTGAWAALQSTIPPMTLPSWSSVLTGCNPGIHGILDFTRRKANSYQLEFLNSTHRRVPTLHRILSDQGHRVASIAIPSTWPPEKLHGLQISGFDSPIATTTESLHVEPRARFFELQEKFGVLKFADFEETQLDRAWARRSLLRELDRKEAICSHLLKTEDWELFMVVLGESDTAAHHFWSFYDPGSPRYQTSPANQDTLARIYRRLDTAVGELSKHAGWVCVVSDHGFGGAGTQALYLNRFLEQQGWLCYRQSAHAQLEPLRQLALSLPLEKLLRRMPASLPGYLESHTRYQSIEFSKTHAWSDELSYAPSIHLNCQGRDPKGILSNRSHAIATLTRLLLDWKIEGKSVVAKVIPREEAMQGPETCYAPDLFLELALENGYSQTLLPSSRVPSGTLSRRLEPFEWPGGRGLGMNGTHRPLGVFALGGPNVQAGEIAASVKDLAPTLLALTGHSIPEHMDGKLLPIFQQTPSIHYTALSLTAAPKDTSFFQQKILQKRLQKLGYL